MEPLLEESVQCPCCGEPIRLLVDLSAGSQTYIEDCFVCCRPIQVELDARDPARPVLNLTSAEH